MPNKILLDLIAISKVYVSKTEECINWQRKNLPNSAGRDRKLALIRLELLIEIQEQAQIQQDVLIEALQINNELRFIKVPGQQFH